MVSEPIKKQNISAQPMIEKEEKSCLKRLEIALSHLAFALGQERQKQEEARRHLEQKYKVELSCMAQRVVELETNITTLIEKLMEKEKG